jgi:transcription antitermination factor NusG
LGNATLVIDQAHLETVIPKIGHEIKLLKGNLRNQTATLKEVNIQKGIAVVTVDGNIFEVPFN